MASNGFGFGPRNNDDDDEQRRNNENPFSFFGVGGGDASAGGFADIFNQFGQMFSGIGQQMSQGDKAPAVNYEVAERTAQQLLGRGSKVTQAHHDAVVEAVRLVELWLDGSTDLPATGAIVQSWNELDWLSNTMESWKRMVTPMNERMNEAQIESLPEEAREFAAPMLSVMNQFNSWSAGKNVGEGLAELGKAVLSGGDLGLPMAGKNKIALLPRHILDIADELNLDRRDVLIYVAAREAARQRLINNVPWLIEQVFSSVEEYAQGLLVDTSNIEEAARDLNLDPSDPERMQEALNSLQGLDLTPKIRSRNANATTRLVTLIALVEGWVDYVVEDSLGERIPSTKAIIEAWQRRRATGGTADKALEKIVGLETSAPRTAQAHELWRRVTVAVGATRRDAVWDHPDFLPDAEDIEKPAAFIDQLLDAADGDEFDPIAEINALEEMLAQQDNEKKEGDDADDSDKPDTSEDSAEDDKK